MQCIQSRDFWTFHGDWRHNWLKSSQSPWRHVIRLKSSWSPHTKLRNLDSVLLTHFIRAQGFISPIFLLFCKWVCTHKNGHSPATGSVAETVLFGRSRSEDVKAKPFFYYFLAVFRIRIHWTRIRIQPKISIRIQIQANFSHRLKNLLEIEEKKM